MTLIPKKYLCSRCKRDMRKHYLEGGCKCNHTHICETAMSNKHKSFDEKNEIGLENSYYSVIQYKEDHKID